MDYSMEELENELGKVLLDHKKPNINAFILYNGI